MATVPDALQEPPDFSLMLGGPLYQLFQKAHLAGPALELLKRRVLFITVLAWLPLLLLSLVGGHVFGGVGLPFLHDIETHVRFLIAVPVLIIAELVVHQRTRTVVKLFREREIVTPEDAPKFHAIIDTAMRVRNSIPLELALIVFVYTAGHWVWLNDVALGASSWYATIDGTNLHLTLPGYWYCFASIPIFQFLLLRWYLKLFIWYWFLWRVSRLKLRLMPTHPDGAGGIGFVGGSSHALGPLLFAQGAVLAGILSNRILYEGQSLLALKWSIFGLVGFFVLAVLGPLMVFSPHLFQSKRVGLKEYGTLATSYVTDFDEKWLRGGAKNEAFIGTADIQSLSDLANSYAVVRQMRAVPFDFDDIKIIVAATVAPILPLLLTIMPLEELLHRLVKIVF
jgi:hypothetical protein